MERNVVVYAMEIILRRKYGCLVKRATEVGGVKQRGTTCEFDLDVGIQQ